MTVQDKEQLEKQNYMDAEAKTPDETDIRETDS